MIRFSDKNKYRGFTLIELVVVVVVVGILAAVAIPRFLDLGDEAAQAAVDDVAAALLSASALNYAAFGVKSPDYVELVSEEMCRAEVLQPLVRGITLIDEAPDGKDKSTFGVVRGENQQSCANGPGKTVYCTVIGSRGRYSAVGAIICNAPKISG